MPRNLKDPVVGTGSFLATAIGFIDGRENGERVIERVRVHVVGEDVEREVVLPHEPGVYRWVSVDRLAERLGCSPTQITVW